MTVKNKTGRHTNTSFDMPTFSMLCLCMKIEGHCHAIGKMMQMATSLGFGPTLIYRFIVIHVSCMYVLDKPRGYQAYSQSHNQEKEPKGCISFSIRIFCSLKAIFFFFKMRQIMSQNSLFLLAYQEYKHFMSTFFFSFLIRRDFGPRSCFVTNFLQIRSTIYYPIAKTFCQSIFYYLIWINKKLYKKSVLVKLWG